ncbi:unnamed protein product [Euphydryas editha]|uniref:Uncharacterized protein n=1 Tax=Euphydryas editha TaxID=104508 RepID=A0AAU9TP61_EUPED|nr:unnamed protein product [Euphydryas editha]
MTLTRSSGDISVVMPLSRSMGLSLLAGSAVTWESGVSCIRFSASSQSFCESNSTRSLLLETGDTLAGAYLAFRKDILFLNASIVSWRLFDGRFVATISAGRVVGGGGLGGRRHTLALRDCRNYSSC